MCVRTTPPPYNCRRLFLSCVAYAAAVFAVRVRLADGLMDGVVTDIVDELMFFTFFLWMLMVGVFLVVRC